MFVVGVSATGASIGSVIVALAWLTRSAIVFPIVLAKAFASLSYGNAIRIFAAIEFSACALGAFFLRARFVGRRHGRLLDLSPLKDPAYALLCAGFLFVCVASILPAADPVSELGLYLPICPSALFRQL